MKQSPKQVVVAYLSVLGDPLAQESVKALGAEILGCLRDIEELLKSPPKGVEIQGTEQQLLELVLAREKINHVKPSGHPDLVAANKNAIKGLRTYLEKLG